MPAVGRLWPSIKKHCQRPNGELSTFAKVTTCVFASVNKDQHQQHQQGKKGLSCHLQQQKPHQSKLNNISESLIDNARLWSDSYLMKTETKRENRKRPKPKASGRKQLGRLGKCKFLPGRLMGDRFPTEGLNFH